jgi:hypothetical protein
MNRAWHEANVLGRNPTRERRLSWHREHQANCGCRPMPKSVRQDLEGRMTPAPDASVQRSDGGAPRLG